MKAHTRADLYSAYLVASCGATTATGLSELLEGAVSHDQVTWYVAGTKKTATDLWQTVKALVREVQSEAGVLIIDDSIEEKPYTDENDIVCGHYDHSTDRMVQGINCLTALYRSQGVNVPVGFHLVAKTEKYVDPHGFLIKIFPALVQAPIEGGWNSSCGMACTAAFFQAVEQCLSRFSTPYLRRLVLSNASNLLGQSAKSSSAS